jgi:hypothetical protein
LNRYCFFTSFVFVIFDCSGLKLFSREKSRHSYSGDNAFAPKSSRSVGRSWPFLSIEK